MNKKERNIRDEGQFKCVNLEEELAKIHNSFLFCNVNQTNNFLNYWSFKERAIDGNPPENQAQFKYEFATQRQFLLYCCRRRIIWDKCCWIIDRSEKKLSTETRLKQEQERNETEFTYVIYKNERIWGRTAIRPFLYCRSRQIIWSKCCWIIDHRAESGGSLHFMPEAFEVWQKQPYF